MPVATGAKTWWELFLANTVKKLRAFSALRLDFAARDLVVDYLIGTMPLVKDQPLMLQHGDYHVANMLVAGNRVAVIDFDKMGVADPYEDLKPFVWNVWASARFATGLIDGYFDCSIPPGFFEKLAVYAAEKIVSQFVWAAGFGPAEMHTAYEAAASILAWYDNFQTTMPKWYLRRHS